MTVIFQLFCAEDLQRLSLHQLTDLRDTITDILDLKAHPPGRTAGGKPALPLEVNDDIRQPPDAPPEIRDALKRRFDEVSQQLKSPARDASSFDFETLTRRHFNDSNAEERAKETEILTWAISCEVNNFKLYDQLLRARAQAYQKFYDWTQQRPKGPDSPYSPFNPLHPLYSLFPPPPVGPTLIQDAE